MLTKTVTDCCLLTVCKRKWMTCNGFNFLQLTKIYPTSLNLQSEHYVSSDLCILDLSCILGCCFGHGFHETYPTWSNHGEAITFAWQIWYWTAVLHSNTGWSCTFPWCSREVSEGKPTWRSFQNQRQWPLSVPLEATVPSQDFAWNCSNSIA